MLILINVYFQAELNLNVSFLKSPSRLKGVLPWNKLEENHTYLEDEFNRIEWKRIPEKYNVLLKWSECASVVSIKDQSNFRSCWVCILKYIFFLLLLSLSLDYNFSFAILKIIKFIIFLYLQTQALATASAFGDRVYVLLQKLKLTKSYLEST